MAAGPDPQRVLATYSGSSEFSLTELDPWGLHGKNSPVMSDAAICLKPINDLLTERFYVPSYQRGYRWTERQVGDLLSDIWEFQASSEGKEKASFYCLQPIVVKKRSTGEWELVDGQQRLTTILVLLGCLKPLVGALDKTPFQLTFETRSETSGAFLQNIDLAQRDANIDYHYICAAYDAINKWFAGHNGTHKLKFLQCLLNDDEVGRNVKVIWYELPSAEDSVEAFTRLNVGKIPLTNAELIRALFLRSRNFPSNSVTQQQLRIAQEWDAIEKVLQTNEVWYFLQGKDDSHATRIEYVFQLIAREDGGGNADLDDPYATFHYYNARFADPGARSEGEWLRIKRYFMTLEEWFHDRVLYHLIGYLIQDGDDVLAIRKLGVQAAKTAFQRALKERIYKRLVGGEFPGHDQLRDTLDTQLSDLDYESDAPTIRRVLLLFNIAALIENPTSNLRFPFETFKKGEWDIEHVRSVESGKPARIDAQRLWLQNVHDYLVEAGDGEGLVARAQEVLGASQFDTEQFDLIYADILAHFQEADSVDADHGIGNLALLDAQTNRSYKNAVFPLKRKRILGLDRAGTFVPLCTKNLFLKCYSEKIGNMMFWTRPDSESYRMAIVESLVRFFGGISEVGA